MVNLPQTQDWSALIFSRRLHTSNHPLDLPVRHQKFSADSSFLNHLSNSSQYVTIGEECYSKHCACDWIHHINRWKTSFSSPHVQPVCSAMSWYESQLVTSLKRKQYPLQQQTQDRHPPHWIGTKSSGCTVNWEAVCCDELANRL